MDTIVAEAKADDSRALAIRGAVPLSNVGWRRWQSNRDAILRSVKNLSPPSEFFHAVQSPCSNMGYGAMMTARLLVGCARAGERVDGDHLKALPHVFVDERLVERASTVIARLDDGPGPLKSGFEIEGVGPMDHCVAKRCLVLVKSDDRTVGRIANGGSI